MGTSKECYLIDEQGNRLAVLLPLDEYEELVAAASESEPDPDTGRKLKKSLRQQLLRQERAFAKGKRGKPLKDVLKQIGLD